MTTFRVDCVVEKKANMTWVLQKREPWRGTAIQEIRTSLSRKRLFRVKFDCSLYPHSSDQENKKFCVSGCDWCLTSLIQKNVHGCLSICTTRYRGARGATWRTAWNTYSHVSRRGLATSRIRILVWSMKPMCRYRCHRKTRKTCKTVSSPLWCSEVTKLQAQHEQCSTLAALASDVCCWHISVESHADDAQRTSPRNVRCTFQLNVGQPVSRWSWQCRLALGRRTLSSNEPNDRVIVVRWHKDVRDATEAPKGIPLCCEVSMFNIGLHRHCLLSLLILQQRSRGRYFSGREGRFHVHATHQNSFDSW